MNRITLANHSHPHSGRQTGARLIAAAALMSLGLGLTTAQAQAQTAATDLPGKGVSVQPIQGTVDEEMFQTLLVSRALEKLGYQVQATKSLENGTQHVAVAQGDATFTATHWMPLHRAFYENNGGDKAFYRAGTYSRNAVQGYLIDKATAEKYQITASCSSRTPNWRRCSTPMAMARPTSRAATPAGAASWPSTNTWLAWT